MTIKLELEGFEEVLKVFHSLPEKMQRKAVIPAQRDGAKIIMKESKRTMRKGSGRNIKFLKLKAMTRSRKQLGIMIMTGTREQLGIAGDDPYYYPAIQEYGKKGLGGDRAQRNALRNKGPEAIKAIGRRLGIEQDKIVRTMKKVT